MLFAHGAVDAESSGACEHQGEEGGEVDYGDLVDFKGLSFQGYKSCDGEVDDQYECGEAGEYPQYYESGAEDFGEDAKYE
jgi:hypothetical protein